MADDCFSGIVIRGLGEGSYFMSMRHYQKEIYRKLGFKAYPGTLNLKVTKKQINQLKNIEPIKISGFKSGSKTFSGVDCYRARIKNMNGAIIIPNINKHKNIIEFIAPLHIKSELKIKDSDKIKIELLK